LRATVTVSGRTEPDATVSGSSGCAVDRCADRAKAAIDGRWEVRLLLSVQRAAPVATLTAVNAADPTDRTDVKVRLHGKLPPPEPKQKTKRKPASRPPAAKATPTATRAPRTPAPRTLIMIGASLAEGTEPILPGLLPGWSVRSDAKQSRPLSTGLQILAATDVPMPAVLAFSLLTNDDPRNVPALDAAVRASVDRAGRGGCAVWATIVRPPLNGVSHAAANRRLEQLASEPGLAGRLKIVPWAAAARANRGWLAPDGVHATPDGYRARAQMYADAARSCHG
jgi:lysophospholipase L1-like esterase